MNDSDFIGLIIIVSIFFFPIIIIFDIIYQFLCWYRGGWYSEDGHFYRTEKDGYSWHDTENCKKCLSFINKIYL